MTNLSDKICTVISHMIVVLIGLGLAAVLIMAATRPNTMEMIENDKALCLSMGGEYGHYRCFKDGKEI